MMLLLLLLPLIVKAQKVSTQKLPTTVCESASSLLPLWGDQLKKLGRHTLNAATCPSFAYGLGRDALQLVPEMKTYLTPLIETSKWASGGCYSQAENALCFVKISDTYTPSISCRTETLPLFMKLMTGCLSDSSDAECPSFDAESRLILDETNFCENAKIGVQINGELDWKSFTEIEDCQSISNTYNICVKFGVNELKLPITSCVSEPIPSFPAYCRHNFVINTDSDRICRNIFVPALIYTLSGGDEFESCTQLLQDYTLWLKRRLLDAEMKAESSAQSLNTCSRLLTMLNDKYLNPLKQIVETGKEKLLRVDDIIQTLQDQYVIQQSEFGGRQFVEYSQRQKYEEARAQQRLNNERLEKEAQEAEGFNLKASQEYLDDDDYWIRFYGYENFTVLETQAKMAEPRFYLDVKYEPPQDRWGRVMPADMQGFLTVMNRALNSDLKYLFEAAESFYDYITNDANRVTVTEVINRPSYIWTSVPPEKRINNISLQRAIDIRNNLKGIITHAKKQIRRFQETTEQWRLRYCQQTTTNSLIGQTFAAVAMLIQEQINQLDESGM